MKSGWTTVALGDVAMFVRGVTFKPTDVMEVAGPDDVWCLRTSNVQDVLRLDDVRAISRSLVRRNEQYLREGDTLVSSANSWSSVGRACWVPALGHQATFGGFVSVLRAYPDQLDPRYLNLWFRSGSVQAAVRSFGRQTTNISNLDLKRTLSMKLALPPLDEQRRIATLLDHVDALRTKRRATLTYAESLLQSIFSLTFGDPVTNSAGLQPQVLSDWIDRESPITYGILKPGPDVQGGVPYVRVVDMFDGTIDPGVVRRTSEGIAASYKRSTLRPGDLLMSIRGHVGRLAVVPEALAGANITQDSARLRVPERARAYVAAGLSSVPIRRWMDRHTKGVAVQGINLGDLRSLPLPRPTSEALDAFAAQSIELDRIRRAQARHTAELDTLFASLQSRAFAGELDVSKVVLPSA